MFHFAGCRLDWVGEWGGGGRRRGRLGSFHGDREWGLWSGILCRIHSNILVSPLSAAAVILFSVGLREIMLLCYNNVFMQCNLIKCKWVCSGGTNQPFLFSASLLQWVFSLLAKLNIKGLVEPNYRAMRVLALSGQRDTSLRFVPLQWM